MDYHFNRQASLISYSFYQLLYRLELNLPSLVCEKLALIIDLDNLDVSA